MRRAMGRLGLAGCAVCDEEAAGAWKLDVECIPVGFQTPGRSLVTPCNEPPGACGQAHTSGRASFGTPTLNHMRELGFESRRPSSPLVQVSGARTREGCDGVWRPP